MTLVDLLLAMSCVPLYFFAGRLDEWKRRGANGRTDWVRADLSKVPYVIPREEAHGPLLPWYRRLFRGGDPPEPSPSPPPTYR